MHITNNVLEAITLAIQKDDAVWVDNWRELVQNKYALDGAVDDIKSAESVIESSSA